MKQITFNCTELTPPPAKIKIKKSQEGKKHNNCACDNKVSGHEVLNDLWCVCVSRLCPVLLWTSTSERALA